VSRNFVLIILSILALLIGTGCSGGSGSVALGTEPDFSKLTPTCFIPNASNPILTRGAPATIFAADWNDPSVIRVGNLYVMYASSDDNFNLNISVYRLVSNDGLTWTLSPSTPVFEADPDVSAWDHRATETPAVVYFKGQYHMFYTGYPVAYTDSASYKIGHATSADGITWTRDPNNPIVAPNDPYNTVPNLTFNQWVSAEPAPVVFNNKIYLYFTAVGANLGVNNTLEVIGLTTSSDGTTWSTPQSVLEPDQSLYPRTGGTTDWIGYSTPMAAVLNGQVHLFFDVVQNSPWMQLKMHHASSSDGITNWTQDSSPIFTNTDFGWTSAQIRSPTVLLDGTTLYLWFAGDDNSTLGIGEAKCAL
jgi:sucrose-6-phosphate hydrolase SacC (GH32 family)